jgi:hypothetical protein
LVGLAEERSDFLRALTNRDPGNNVVIEIVAIHSFARLRAGAQRQYAHNENQNSSLHGCLAFGR